MGRGDGGWLVRGKCSEIEKRTQKENGGEKKEEEFFHVCFGGKHFSFDFRVFSLNGFFFVSSLNNDINPFWR